MQENTLRLQTVLSLFAAFAVTAGGAVFVGSQLGHGDTVDVTAEVTETVTCSTNATSTDFGTLTTGSISTGSPDATTTVDCNPSAGCTLFVQDQGDGSGTAGLYNSTTSEIIASQDATLSAGSEGYGIQAASSTTGSGGDLLVDAKYDVTGDTVGALSTSDLEIASSSEPISNRKIAVTHKAAISGTTPSGQYEDTITYSCTSN